MYDYDSTPQRGDSISRSLVALEIGSSSSQTRYLDIEKKNKKISNSRWKKVKKGKSQRSKTDNF